jgi:hypothetical protein
LKYPVTFQMIVQVHDGTYHLFEMDRELPLAPFPGLMLANCGVPNVVGPDVGFDNVVRRVVYNGTNDRILACLHGLREATLDIDEARASMPTWSHRGPIKVTGDQQTDVMDGGS